MLKADDSQPRGHVFKTQPSILSCIPCIKLDRSCSLVLKADDSQPRGHVFKTQPSIL